MPELTEEQAKLAAVLDAAFNMGRINAQLTLEDFIKVAPALMEAGDALLVEAGFSFPPLADVFLAQPAEGGAEA